MKKIHEKAKPRRPVSLRWKYASMMGVPVKKNAHEPRKIVSTILHAAIPARPSGIERSSSFSFLTKRSG